MTTTARIVTLRTEFELDTTDEQIARLDAAPSDVVAHLLRLYWEAADLDPEEDGAQISALWGRIAEVERQIGLL